MRYKIIHLDCARKYFRPAVLKGFVDIAAECGYNQLELYFSDNQGFRLALPDMVVTVEGEQYDLSEALGDGYADEENGMRPDGSGSWLSPEELQELFAHAGSLGVELVPAVNSPGHMGAILEHFPHFRYARDGKISSSTLNFSDPSARAFGLALLEKYVAFFASCGAKVFNLVADEVAQELGGFELLLKNGDYPAFMNYLKEAIGIVKRYGLIPRVFNDGLYRGPERAVPAEVEVCHCFPMPVSAAALAEKGHAIINGSLDFFWVLGKPDWQLKMENPEDVHVHKLSDGSTIRDLAGGMVSIWCDMADALSDKETMKAVYPLLQTFSQNRGLNE